MDHLIVHFLYHINIMDRVRQAVDGRHILQEMHILMQQGRKVSRSSGISCKLIQVDQLLVCVSLKCKSPGS